MFGLNNSLTVFPPDKNRVAIYNRCSSDKQEESLDVQVAESRERAQAKGWVIAEQYIELKSGTTTDGRTEYLRLIEDMSKDKFDIVMIKSLDRLMRNALDWLNFLKVLSENNLMFYTYIDNRFYERDSCYLLYMFQSAMNEEFSVQLSKKLKNAHNIRQSKQSGWNFSHTPFGWNKIDQKTYEINEEEAGYIRRAFELIKQGCGFYTISLKLYEEGLRNKKGKKMDGSTLKNILRSERLCGTVVMNRESVDFKTKKRFKNPCEDWIIVENAIPAILTKEEWLELQSIIESRHCDTAFQGHKYPLSGKIVCGLCGERYHRFMYERREKGAFTGEKIPYWKCISAYRNGRSIPEISCMNESVDEAKLMRIIDDTAESYFGSLYGRRTEIIENLLSLIKKAIEQASDLGSLSKLKSELKKQIARKDVLFEKLTNETISDEEFKLYNQRVTDEINRLQTKIALIENRHGNLIENERRLEEIRATLTETDLIERCKAARTQDMIDKIVVNGNGTVSIHWNKLRMLGLINLAELGERADDSEFIVTVSYNGYIALKDKVARQKEQILSFVKDNPRASYSKIGAAIGASKAEVASRLRYLFLDGLVERDDTGALIVK